MHTPHRTPLRTPFRTSHGQPGRAGALRLHRLLAAACLAGTALAASAQSEPTCEQIAAELKALSTPTPQGDAAAAAVGAQVLGALAQQAGARGGLGGMFGGLMGGGSARPTAAQGQAAQALQVLQVVQAVQGAQAGEAPPAQAQQGAAVQAAALQALAQPRGVGNMTGGQAAQAAGVMGLLGGLMSAAQASQPVTTPGNQALTELAGSRQEQLGGLYLAKGCKAPA